MLFVLVACTSDAREDVQQAQQSIDELGEAAQKGAEQVDARAQKAGEELATKLDDARDKLVNAKDIADRAGEAYMAPSPTEEEKVDAVRCAGEHYAIDRATVDRAITSPMQVAGATSIEPVAGKGYRVTRVDPDSPVAQLDVRVGDILVDVDGTKVDALDGARLVTRLREADEVSFTLERDGETLEKTVAIEG
jgi:C-terminal processing protease CtpA/Prc